MSVFNLFQANILACLCVSFITCIQIPGMPSTENLEKIPFKGKPVSPCRACRSLVTSFLKAVEETGRQNFEGGDADWEKKKLRPYENSELRFIEIQEKTCADVGRGKDQCYNLAEEHEADLEEWFFAKRLENVDLLESLCLNKLQVCCPNNTYGPDCIPCPGGIETPCGGHGKCLNGGTKDEPASCFCDAGYVGDLCDQCAKGYYQEESSSSLSCKLCDMACKGHCRGPGPKNCEVCAFGYRFVPNEGCVGHYDDYKRKVLMKDLTSNLSSEKMNDDNSESASSINDDSGTASAQLSEHSEL
ncbi:protein disulfide isomerase Creld1-like [Uloborus diversus]|uniref:protein disulfide isomerase Creld1-like n=1 Tax=Uloborus diversus TaxID=327109 RepID=UPI002409D740|nr:protein disulfide isomerase Creld1-like [Uloborus diversus]